MSQMAEKRSRHVSVVSGKKGERERYELRRRTQEELYRTFNKISDLKRGMVWIEKKIRQSQRKADPLDVFISEELAISDIYIDPLMSAVKICEWFVQKLKKTCSTWNEAAEFLTDPTRTTVENASLKLMEQVELLQDYWEVEPLDNRPERLAAAIEETHQETHKVLKSLEMCDGEGVAPTREAALIAEAAANHAAEKLRQKLETEETRNRLN